MPGRPETAASTQPGGVRTLMPRPLSSHTTSSGSGSRWYAQYPAVLSAPTAVEWLIEASPFNPRAYGAFPEYEFDHQQRPIPSPRSAFAMPNLSLPQDFAGGRLDNRLSLLHAIDQQRDEGQGPQRRTAREEPALLVIGQHAARLAR